jgi:hypothetical protein
MVTPIDTIHRTGSVAVIRIDEEFKLLSARTVSRDERLLVIEGELTSTPTRYSVQVGPSSHVDLPADHRLEEILDKFYWRFMNHSCEPNAVIRGREIYSLRALEPWEEVTFNYNTTEYDIAEPFDCCCGNPCCSGRICGFRYLPGAEQERLRPHLAHHLLSVLDDDGAGMGRSHDGEYARS